MTHGERRSGSRECRDGQIFVESNAFCAMAEVGAESGKPLRALDSVHARLGTPYGIVLLDPPYSGYRVELGEISSYPPGYKENGSVFCHNNPWVMIAECIAGKAREGLRVLPRASPLHTCRTSRTCTGWSPTCTPRPSRARARPGRERRRTRGSTGTAAWSFVAVSQWILGIRPDFDGLRIEPCLPRAFGNVEVMRIFRGCTYRITVRNRRPAAGRAPSLRCRVFPAPPRWCPPVPRGASCGW